MMRKPERSADFQLIGGSILIALIFVAIAMSVLGTAVSHWVRQDARIQSAALAEALAGKLPDLAGIVSGTAPSQQETQALALMQALGRTTRIILATPDGDPVLRVEDRRVELLRGPSAPETRLTAANTPDRLHTTVERNLLAGRISITAVTTLPVQQEGRTVALLETVIDESELAAGFRKDLILASLVLACLLGLAFAICFSWIMTAVRARNASEERAEFLASHDRLTGLLNRTAFQARLETALSELDRGRSIALHHLDIDRFKRINDELGEDGADGLIRLVALRLSEMVRPGDFVARLGGDELIVAQCGITSAQQAEAMAARLVEQLSEVYALEGREVQISVSAGTSLAPADTTVANELMTKASMALQFVKSTGSRGSGFFSDTMEEELNSRRQLEQLLRSAIQNNLLSLNFQPILSLSQNRISGFEALMRMSDGSGTPVSPALFIPVAEELGLLPEFGEWALRQACGAAVGWGGDIAVAVNLSPTQFASGNLPQKVADALQASGLQASRLELEITEGILLQDTGAILQQLTDLKALGVSIVMDDFGTGYSSLSYLWRFPFDKLKIDRSFMEAYSHSGETIQQILKAIVALGRALKMQVTIEGIETVFQARVIRDLEIDNVQGYLFGKPVTAAEIPGVMLRDMAKAMNTGQDTAPSATPGPKACPKTASS